MGPRNVVVEAYAWSQSMPACALTCGPNYHVALRSSKSMYDNERSSHEKMDVAWQCLVGRYAGCFVERYNETYDDRAYHAKELDAPEKFAPTLKVRKGNTRYRRG